MTTFPSLPSDKETSGLGPTWPSGRFNYKRQRTGREAWVAVCVHVCVSVGVGILEFVVEKGVREWSDDFISQGKFCLFLNCWVKLIMFNIY